MTLGEVTSFCFKMNDMMESNGFVPDVYFSIESINGNPFPVFFMWKLYNKKHPNGKVFSFTGSGVQIGAMTFGKMERWLREFYEPLALNNNIEVNDTLLQFQISGEKFKFTYIVRNTQIK